MDIKGVKEVVQSELSCREAAGKSRGQNSELRWILQYLDAYGVRLMHEAESQEKGGI